MIAKSSMQHEIIRRHIVYSYYLNFASLNFFLRCTTCIDKNVQCKKKPSPKRTLFTWWLLCLSQFKAWLVHAIDQRFTCLRGFWFWRLQNRNKLKLKNQKTTPAVWNNIYKYKCRSYIQIMDKLKFMKFLYAWNKKALWNIQ